MRTSIGIIGLFTLAVSASAQDRGFVSGTLGFGSHKVDREGSTNDETTSSVTVGPAVGFNIDAANVVGVALTYSSSKYEYSIGSTNVTDKDALFEIAPFYRRMKSVGDKFFLYGQLKVGMGFGKGTRNLAGPDDPAETKISTFRAGIGPGFVFVPATHWALSADWGLFGYAGRKETQELPTSDVETKTSDFGLDLRPGNITLALNWLF